MRSLRSGTVVVVVIVVVIALVGGACSGAKAAKQHTSKPAASAPAPAAKPVATAAPATTPAPAPPPETAPIYFGFNSAALELDAGAQANLRRLGDYLIKHPEARIIIEGNADERGTSDYNLALGDQRARAAVAYLVRLGVRQQQIVFKSYGEERPAASGHDETSWAKNRRDEIKLDLSALQQPRK